jgi:hypothetical protein
MGRRTFSPAFKLEAVKREHPDLRAIRRRAYAGDR